ncbi:hypothetical protein HDA32_001997 [Spinactinospora alkalitolerans]|uniref:N-acetyltransferase domain-containing protein n=1 Tax=Spinactinospora alkalitolerans TaxID=687207 RepID=A0A852TU95_9ACTN|nr:hypothetical protein [Spinactinospora alkalitolerans]NYE46877.1 hypothetical protein [Spinactinospora alkalitolerans]
MLWIRSADTGDRDGIAAMIGARTAWMSERGLRFFEGAADTIARQAGDPEFLVWVLVQDGGVLGCTTVFDESPEWAFTETERAEPALFLASTWTMPSEGRRLGFVIARWALDHAARSGRTSVRRGAFEQGLMRYYCQVQGWTLLRELERRGRTAYIMARPAELQPDLAVAVPTGR